METALSSGGLGDNAQGNAIFTRALALRDIGRLEESLADCDMAIQKIPESVDANFLRAVILRDLGRDTELVLAALEDTIKIDPDHEVAYDYRADVLRALGRDEDADRDAAKADELRAAMQ